MTSTKSRIPAILVCNSIFGSVGSRRRRQYRAVRRLCACQRGLPGKGGCGSTCGPQNPAGAPFPKTQPFGRFGIINICTSAAGQSITATSVGADGAVQCRSRRCKPYSTRRKTGARWRARRRRIGPWQAVHGLQPTLALQRFEKLREMMPIPTLADDSSIEVGRPYKPGIRTTKDTRDGVSPRSAPFRCSWNGSLSSRDGVYGGAIRRIGTS